MAYWLMVVGAILLAIFIIGWLVIEWNFSIRYTARYDDDLQVTARSWPGELRRQVESVSVRSMQGQKDPQSGEFIRDPLISPHPLDLYIDGRRINASELTKELLEELGASPYRFHDDAWDLEGNHAWLSCSFEDGEIVDVRVSYLRYHEREMDTNIGFSWKGQAVQYFPMSWREMKEYFGNPKKTRRIIDFP